MRVDEFDFELPENLIALHPVEPRDSARLLHVTGQGMRTDRSFGDLEQVLRPGDVLVINDTKVLPAKLEGVRHRGEFAAKVSFNLHKRIDSARWAAFARPAKKLRTGDVVVFGQPEDRGCAAQKLQARVAGANEGGEVTLCFDLSGAYLDEAIKSLGAMPLPPYIGSKRAIEKRDEHDYQTVYATRDGAVAAPTAGLHFSAQLLQELEKRGVGVVRLTLHVGAGTFLPMKANDTKDHVMHAEWGEIDEAAVAQILKAKSGGGRVIAVGTTSLRLLESACRKKGALQAFCGDTDIFITPGFDFRIVDVLMTNFHLPRSTLFMLVSAFSGLDEMKGAYAHAIRENYRFYSYGDACLLERKGAQS